jgi:ribonuclease-3
MDRATYSKFASEALGVEFNNLDLLITAFTHRSYLNEHRKTVTEHNERLEFLGDAVLELVVTQYLYTHYPDPEGILTNWRSSLVRTESIGAAAARNGFESLLLLSRGEKRGTERARAQILANSFEAVIGALYLKIS